MNTLLRSFPLSLPPPSESPSICTTVDVLNYELDDHFGESFVFKHFVELIRAYIVCIVGLVREQMKGPAVSITRPHPALLASKAFFPPRRLCDATSCLFSWLRDVPSCFVFSRTLFSTGSCPLRDSVHFPRPLRRARAFQL